MGSLYYRDVLSPAAVVDRLAAKAPHDVWVKVPVSSNNGPMIWRDISWLQLKRAVDSMAYWMENKLGLGGGDEPVAYVGVNDIRFPIVIMAALKCGYKSLLLSPRNSQEGNLTLLRATQCTKCMFTPELRGLVQEMAVQGHPVWTTEVPALQDLLADSHGIDYKSCANPYMGDQETVMILHSSGTTGLPKPVYLKAGVVRVAAESIMMPAPKGRRNAHSEMYSTKLLLSTIPFFHIYGIQLFIRSIYYQGPLALLPAGQPPTADLLLKAMSKVQPTAVVCPPSILEDICNLPDGLEELSKVDSVFYGGAPLARSCGDRITQATTLVSTIGSTEAFNLANMVVEDPVNWEYFEWNPNTGIVMESTGDDHLAELVIRRQHGNEHQPVFHNFPNFTEWRTNDLYEQHPTKSALWKYVGRADDVVVLSNGEKMNPVSFEKAVEGHPWVRGALVVGTGQFQTGLVIELHYEQAPADSERLLDELWSWVEQANAQCPAHARVWQSMVTLAMPTKPFKRSPKGSVMRKATYQLYEDEIKLLYDKTTPMNGITNNVELHNSQQIRDIISKAVHSMLHARIEITDDTNIFTVGVDSLQVMQLRRILSSDGIPCTARMVYENPSITLLSRAASSKQNTTCACNSVSREEKMSTMIHRYQCSSRPAPPMTTQPGHSSSCVLLIGSTGALGTHLLHGLLQNPKVNRVYCLNRSADAAERQVRSFVDRGLDSDIGDVKTHPKVRFFTSSTSQENFGLSRYDYAALAQHIDMVILNAWPVNFNTPLETFEGVIAGTKRCVDFAAASARRPHIAFVSSIASVMNFPAVRPRGDDGQLLVPEEFDPDNSLPAKQGYGESKHVAACILARAAREGLIEATVLRVGQLAGTSAEGKGVWNRHEWLPSLVKTSKSLGRIPDSLGAAHDEVAWVPVDVAAKAILELTPLGLATRSGVAFVNCYNVVNPQIARWSGLVAAVQQYFAEKGQPIARVGFDEWLRELGTIGKRMAADTVEEYPALKLVDFFKAMAADGAKGRWGYATKRAVDRSAAMAEMRPVDEGLMRKWLEEWMF